MVTDVVAYTKTWGNQFTTRMSISEDELNQ